MRASQETIDFCRKQLMVRDIAENWRVDPTTIDWDELTEEILRHLPHVAPEKIDDFFDHFVKDYPLVAQLKSNVSCQSELIIFLDKIASKKFPNLPSSLSPMDIVQEALIKLLKKLQSFHYRADLRTWCSTVLFHAGIDLLRKEKTKRKYKTVSLDSPLGDGEDTNMHEIIEDTKPGPEAIYLRREIRSMIDAALEKSKNPRRDHKIVEMKLAGLQSEQISDELEITVETVDMAMNRLKNRLKGLRSWKNSETPQAKESSTSRP